MRLLLLIPKIKKRLAANMKVQLRGTCKTKTSRGGCVTLTAAQIFKLYANGRVSGDQGAQCNRWTRSKSHRDTPQTLQL